MNFKRKLLIICLMFVPSLVLGCKMEESLETINLIEPISISEVTETATIGEISNIRVLEGYVIPYTEELTFNRQGEFLSYYVKIGDEVTEGDELAELNNESHQNMVEQIKESIEELQVQYENTKKEVEQEKIIKTNYLDELREQIKKDNDNNNKTGNEVANNEKSEGSDELDSSINVDILDMRKTNKDIRMQEILYEYDIKILDENMKLKKELYEVELKKLNENLEDAKNNLNQHKILAPFDGKIVALSNLSKGSQVNEDSLIIGIVDTKDTRVTCGYISETDIENSEDYYMFKNGEKYDITYLPYDKDVYASLIMRKETPVSTFLYQGDEPDIRQGDYVLICVVEDRKEDVLIIPVYTLFRDANGEYVYRSIDGKKVKTYVITGVSDDMFVEIKEGLEEGDQVYVEN